MYSDKTITCKDCGTAFTFTAGEQEFFAEKGFDNEPTRCKSCRTARKNAPKTGSSREGGSRDRAPRQMYDAVCAECGKACKVPFQPRTDRPVMCSDCFRSNR